MDDRLKDAAEKSAAFLYFQAIFSHKITLYNYEETNFMGLGKKIKHHVHKATHSVTHSGKKAFKKVTKATHTQSIFSKAKSGFSALKSSCCSKFGGISVFNQFLNNKKMPFLNAKSCTSIFSSYLNRSCSNFKLNNYQYISNRLNCYY